ncbi:MAG: CNP1-like family protein [Sulfuritalea sp.]|nr:CNP1-like family protein [Sulfuritalea sp.]
MKHIPACFLLWMVASAFAQAPDPLGIPRFNTNFEEGAPWQEQQEVALPAFPRQEDLREFYVSPVATNMYLIDVSTLAVGTDGVVRYVLVVKTSGGATNISFEGINCRDRSWKHYATGRSDGTWAKSRASRIEWRPIENKPVNRHHAALSRDFFCPTGNAINTADEGRNALRLGKHPNSN